MPPLIHTPRPAAVAAVRRPAPALAVLLVVAALCGACGKKGPPLAPIVKTAATMADFSARRSGDTVFLRFTVPATNTDATGPADLSRIEIYAYTAEKDIEGLEAKDMTLVSEVVVRRPPDPDEDRESKDKPAAERKPAKPRPPEPGVDQGTIVTVTDALTAETMMLTRLPKRLVPPPIEKVDQPNQGSKLELPTVGPVLEAKPRRFYVAYGVNRSGQRGSPSPKFVVAFDALPPPPGTPRLDAKAKTLEISWDPPQGAAAAIEHKTTTEPLLSVTTRGTLVPVLPSYNVYLVSKSPTPEKPGVVRPPELPLPLNDKPLTKPSFVDEKIEFGVERCYQVRTVNTVGATVQLTTATATATPAGVAPTPAISESVPSAIACATAADTVAPPAPTSLAAVASSGAISLIWTGVDVPDLAGYLVLRGSAPDGPLAPLFTQPIRETTYRDITAKAGTNYVYAVVAVDTASPPNRSPMSNKATETAR